MPRRERVAVDVSDLTLLDPHGGTVGLGELVGVQLLVLLRHRH